MRSDAFKCNRMHSHAFLCDIMRCDAAPRLRLRAQAERLHASASARRSKRSVRCRIFPSYHARRSGGRKTRGAKPRGIKTRPCHQWAPPVRPRAPRPVRSQSRLLTWLAATPSALSSQAPSPRCSSCTDTRRQPPKLQSPSPKPCGAGWRGSRRVCRIRPYSRPHGLSEARKELGRICAPRHARDRADLFACTLYARCDVKNPRQRYATQTTAPPTATRLCIAGRCAPSAAGIDPLNPNP